MRQYASYAATGSQWLDSIPAHWKMGRLDYVARAWPSSVDKHSVEGELPVRLCNYTDVYKNDVIADGIPFMSATATAEQVERFRIKIGDTIITKDSETADDIGIPAFVDYEADDLVCGYHLSIVRPDPTGVFPKYLFWALRAQPTLGQWEVLASGVTRVGLRSGDVSKAALALPPIDEQRAIADYLDRETARIDTLIEEQQRLIETLRERWHAQVDHAVWSGIDGDAPKVPAPIEPAPDVPMHWRVLRNKNLLCESTAVSAGAGGELLSVSHLTGITPRSEKNVTMIESENLDGYRLVEPGDLVINTMWAWMGALGVSRLAGIVSPAYGVYRPSPGAEFHPPYFDYLYRSRPYVVEMTRFSRGIWSSRLRIYPEVFLRLNIVVPPLDEQRRIADYLDEQTAKIDTLIAETETFIELARERRSALITAAVTGQIDVRGAA